MKLQPVKHPSTEVPSRDVNWKRLPTGHVIQGSHVGARTYEIVRPLLNVGDEASSSCSTGTGGSIYIVREKMEASIVDDQNASES